MLVQWNVIKSDGSSLGPLTALEIRDSLRLGTIEPFDLVCRVGSKVQQPLVEVDEIFLAADHQQEKRTDSVYDNAFSSEHGSNETITSEAVGSSVPQRSQHTYRRDNNGQSVQNPNPIPRISPVERSKRNAKKYYLVDKKKRHYGPLSASEIQSLFYRGLVEQGVFVAKGKDGPRVAVQQFVAAYVGVKAKKFKSDQTKFRLDGVDSFGRRRGLPSSKVMDQLARTAVHQLVKPSRSQPILVISIIVAAILLAVIGIKKFRSQRDEAKKSNASESVGEENGAVRFQVPETEESGEQPINSNFDRPQGEPIVPKFEEKPHALSEAEKPKAKIKPRRESKKTKKKPQPKPRKPTPRRVYSPPRVVPKPIVPATRPQPAPAVVRAVPLNPYASKVGQAIALSNVRYSIAALDSCGLKCTLSIQDSRRISFKVIFFKAQYEPVLRQKAGVATFTGRFEIQGNINILYLQGVR